jgi:hypothetical protein
MYALSECVCARKRERMCACVYSGNLHSCIHACMYVSLCLCLYITFKDIETSSSCRCATLISCQLGLTEGSLTIPPGAPACICLYASVCAHVCMYVCMYVCINGGPCMAYARQPLEPASSANNPICAHVCVNIYAFPAFQCINEVTSLAPHFLHLLKCTLTFTFTAFTIALGSGRRSFSTKGLYVRLLCASGGLLRRPHSTALNGV